MVLPSNIVAQCFGLGESEYDAYGELAPVTWTCGCGSWMVLELFNHESEEYDSVSQERKDEFLAEHTGHKMLCFKCRKVEVDFVNAWCDECERKQYDQREEGDVIEF